MSDAQKAEGGAPPHEAARPAASAGGTKGGSSSSLEAAVKVDEWQKGSYPQDPFSRTRGLLRTPPRPASLPEASMDYQMELTLETTPRSGSRKVKRRAVEEISAEATEPRGADEIRTLTEGMERLQAMIAETGIPKRELKAKAAEVMQLIRLFGSKAKIEGGPKLKSGCTDDLTGDLSPLRVTKEVGVQTVDAIDLEEELLVDKLRGRIAVARDPRDVIRLIEEDWPKRGFVNTKLTKASILTEKDIRVILVSENSEEDAKVVRRIGSQFQAIASLLPTQALPCGKVATLINQDQIFVDDEAGAKTAPRALLFAKISNVESVEEVLEVTTKLMDQLTRVRDSGKVPSDGQVVVYFPEQLNLTTARKVMECVLKDGSLKVELCTRKAREAKAQGSAASDKPSTKTLIVKSKAGKTYADTLRELKCKVRPEEEGIKVQGIMKTKDGDVKLRVREMRAGASSQFVTSITEHTKLMAEAKSEFNMTLIVKGLDQAITANEIMEALNQVTGGECTVSRINEPRVGRFDKTAIVRVSRAAGKQLLSKGWVKIGWLRCPLQEWITLGCCFNCQRFGHRAVECKDERSQRRCFKCGDNDHIAKECKRQPHCYACDSDHAVNSMACPLYRENVMRARNMPSQGKKATLQQTDQVSAESRNDPMNTSEGEAFKGNGEQLLDGNETLPWKTVGPKRRARK